MQQYETNNVKPLEHQHQHQHLLTLATQFWEAKADCLEQQKCMHEALYKSGLMSWIHSGSTQEEYDASDGGWILSTQEELSRRIQTVRKHASILSLTTTDQEARTRQAWLATMFSHSQVGLQFGGLVGKRDNSKRESFSDKMRDFYHVYYRGQDSRLGIGHWDIVSGSWLIAGHFRAGHIFAYMHGTVLMDAVFGDGAGDEMFEPVNGLYLPWWIGDIIDVGFMAIIPDVADDATDEEREQWLLSDPKEYKFKILDKEYYAWTPELMGATHGADALAKEPEPSPPPIHKIHTLLGPSLYDTNGLIYGQLDNRRLQFRGPNRPRARYLYYLYCVNILRFTWRRGDKAANLLESQLGGIYWGSPSKYVQEGMIKSFVEEVGHRLPEMKYDSSFAESASKCVPSSDDELLSTAAILQAEKSIAKECGEDDEDDDEEDDDDDDDDDDDEDQRW